MVNFPYIWKLASETNESKTIMRRRQAVSAPSAHKYRTNRLLRALGGG